MLFSLNLHLGFESANDTRIEKSLKKLFPISLIGLYNKRRLNVLFSFLKTLHSPVPTNVCFLVYNVLRSFLQSGYELYSIKLQAI